MTSIDLVAGLAAPGLLLGTALLSAALIVLLKPLLIRYALARPNARSSHRVPTPQGGGIAVVGACLLVAGVVLWALNLPLGGFLVVAAASVALAVVGAVDDIRPLPAGPRLLLQVAAVAAVVAASQVRVLPDAVPLVLEQGLLILGGVWFVNLVNFMDGLDWITVAEMVPVTAFVAVFGLFFVPEPGPAPLAARFSASPPSTSRWQNSSSGMWARCRSACWSAGCCWSLPARARFRRRCCCRSTT
jgi:UDP-N-acetylmuramyl pentapeptide phosphotransferase/UDP-N-acetylglucosamine-1-phosphate transferase